MHTKLFYDAIRLFPAVILIVFAAWLGDKGSIHVKGLMIPLLPIIPYVLAVFGALLPQKKLAAEPRRSIGPGIVKIPR